LTGVALIFLIFFKLHEHQKTVSHSPSFCHFAYQLTHFCQQRRIQHFKNENSSPKKKILKEKSFAYCQLSLIAWQAELLLGQLLEICIQSECLNRKNACPFLCHLRLPSMPLSAVRLGRPSST